MVLDGASVLYGSASELRETLEYDFTQEKKYSYKGLSIDEMIHHLAVFVANLWQIHVFGEGKIPELRQFFLLNISEHWDLMPQMIYLQKMPGIFEMPWFVQTIMT